MPLFAGGVLGVVGGTLVGGIIRHQHQKGIPQKKGFPLHFPVKSVTSRKISSLFLASYGFTYASAWTREKIRVDNEIGGVKDEVR